MATIAEIGGAVDPGPAFALEQLAFDPSPP
jgi:hypothetical protein